ncbi:MAG: PqqD family protein, partial [Clostridia bacterium]|nr:PqqD family protein [Clostridia bacterium]
PGFILQKIGEETYAVAVTPASAEVGSMVRLNPTGAFLFALLEEEQTEESCLAALLERYEIDPEVARADLAAFLRGLREADLLA